MSWKSTAGGPSISLARFRSTAPAMSSAKATSRLKPIKLALVSVGADRAIIAVLLGCSLRRRELAEHRIIAGS